MIEPRGGGVAVTGRLCDLGPVNDVFLRREYDYAVVDWPSVRTIIDCGANVGAFTAWARRQCRAEVLAVEPSATSVECLRRLADAENGSVRVLEAAVGATRGSVEFFETLGGVSSILPVRQGWDPNVVVSKVAMVTLADVFEQSGFDYVDVLKFDTEGGEHGVFEGADRVLLRRVGVLFAEIHPSLGGNVQAALRAAVDAGMDVATEPGLGDTVLVVGWRPPKG